MREVSCPSCAAPVKFTSAQSLLAVCGYCRATLIRRDLDVEQVGTMAALLEDVTPLQLGAEGVWRGTRFAVVGRLQVRWDGGRWNEWYCAFDDGRGGWLGEAAGEFSVLFETTVAEPLPEWKSLGPGTRVTLGGVAYEVTDRREAEVIGGEGELPFRAPGRSLVVACGACGAVLDAQSADHRVIARYEAKRTVPPRIPLGSRHARGRDVGGHRLPGPAHALRGGVRLGHARRRARPGPPATIYLTLAGARPYGR